MEWYSAHPCCDGLVHSIAQHLSSVLLIVLLLCFPLMGHCGHSCCCGYWGNRVYVHCYRRKHCRQQLNGTAGELTCSVMSEALLDQDQLSMLWRGHRVGAPVTTSNWRSGFQMFFATHIKASVPCWLPSTATNTDTMFLCTLITEW
jgi:hypothetical protein